MLHHNRRYYVHHHKQSLHVPQPQRAARRAQHQIHNNNTAKRTHAKVKFQEQQLLSRWSIKHNWLKAGLTTHLTKTIGNLGRNENSTENTRAQSALTRTAMQSHPPVQSLDVQPWMPVTVKHDGRRQPLQLRPQPNAAWGDQVQERLPHPRPQLLMRLRKPNTQSSSNQHGV